MFCKYNIENSCVLAISKLMKTFLVLIVHHATGNLVTQFQASQLGTLLTPQIKMHFFTW